MARTKQSYLSSRQRQYTEGWNTSVPFGENENLNENSQQRCGSGNSSRQITPAPERDISVSVSVPETGRSFQYVTSTGKRKNYVIRSYDPVSGLHSVQRTTIHGNQHQHQHSENSYCHSRKHSYKPKEVLLEAMMPKIRWLDEQEEQEQSPKSIELSRRRKRRAMNALATAENPLSEIARNVSEPEDNDNKEDDKEDDNKEDDSTKIRDPLLPRKRSRTSYFIGDLPESTPAGQPKQPELVENDLVVSREASQSTLQDASPNDCANASIRVDTEHARMADVAGYGPDRTEGTTMAVKVRIGNKAWTLPQQLERSDLLAARKRRSHRSKKASATADGDGDADAEPSTAADSSVSVRGRKGARTMRLNVRVGNGVLGLPQKIMLRNVMGSPKGRPRSMRKKDTTPVAEQTTNIPETESNMVADASEHTRRRTGGETVAAVSVRIGNNIWQLKEKIRKSALFRQDQNHSEPRTTGSIKERETPEPALPSVPTTPKEKVLELNLAKIWERSPGVRRLNRTGNNTAEPLQNWCNNTVLLQPSEPNRMRSKIAREANRNENILSNIANEEAKRNIRKNTESQKNMSESSRQSNQSKTTGRETVSKANKGERKRSDIHINSSHSTKAKQSNILGSNTAKESDHGKETGAKSGRKLIHSEESESQNAFRASRSKTTGSKIGANKREKIEAKQKTKSQSATASSSIKQKRSNPSISRVGETSLSSVMVRQRVAFEFGNGIYFGTIKTCNTDHSSESKWSWEVLFDDGDLYEFDRDDMRKTLAWYERIMNEEAHCWKPAGAELRSVAAGDRIVWDCGSGVYLGSVSRCRTEHKFESKWTWELRFDDGEVYNVDAEEMEKSIALSEAIRAWEKKQSPPNIDERKEKVTDGDNESSHSVPPLSSVTTGDRIAYRFSEDNVHFGTVTDCNVLGMKLRPSNASSWTISFDKRGIQTFNSNQMKKGLALYETIRAREQNDPKRDEKLQKLESAFLKQKEKVESILPDDVKKRFLELGFARWEKRYLPVLFLGPYDISPGSVRDQWLSEFKKSGGQSVPQIVYWLGSDPSSGFSLLPNKDCISLVKARRNGLVKYKPGNKSGSKTFNNALEELFAALKKPRGEARIPFEKINETHERVCGPKADRLLAEIL
eukprot:CAMPEP_0172372890 /NCGR_PEP_ID=MMETSP1060-20121228/49553_1 /TAXON_ID=37318 /ORGANISM="Pseudo-nitzschia pungens, Strain cf. cingulata" /LENGTH=1134 /DNA_ID=CAMNT_0013099037 /DNA_START=79 /DNA_END=3483 /DNA_ORIENTATION=-